jgi:uncharacterized protein YbjQ (UPF0145 family)
MGMGMGTGMGMGMGMAASPFAGAHSGFVQNYQCPHNMMSAEHRRWGQNYEQTWVQDAWQQGYSSAYARMLEEATELKAHGVVGVFDTVHHLSDTGAVEFHLWGTAVRLRDEPNATSPPWTTFLAGQRLAKIFEAGYAPVSIVASVSSVRVWAYCTTEYLMGGAGLSMWANTTDPLEVDQIVNARSAARQLVRKSARAQLHGDSLHGVSVTISNREMGQGDYQTECLLRGNRIRRFKDFDPLPVPRPTVRLS